MQSKTNRDIWFEVLRYIEIDLSADSREETQLKRRTILSVALTHPDLVDVALDELWRSMESLEPIVRVLNAPSTGLIDVLVYDHYLSFWVSYSNLSGLSHF